MHHWHRITAITVSFLFFLNTHLIAGEIVIAPQSDNRSKEGGAASNRETARRYQQGEDSSPPPSSSIVIIPEEEEEGVLSPRRMGVPADNRSKAREYIQGPGLQAVIVLPPDQVTKDPPPASTRENVEKNRGRARSYLDGGSGTGSKPGTYVQIGTSTGVIDKNGVIVFDCTDTSNIAGRIGDDARSGSEFTVVIGGRNYKARCR